MATETLDAQRKKTPASQPTNKSISLPANKVTGRRFSPATLPFDNRPEVSTRRMRSEVRILLMSNLATIVRLRHLQFHIKVYIPYQIMINNECKTKQNIHGEQKAGCHPTLLLHQVSDTKLPIASALASTVL